MSERRVVVTGMGLICPLGQGVQECWPKMVAGASGIRRITRFDASGLPVHIAGEIEPLPRVPEDEQTDWLGIHTRFALIAAREAFASAGLVGGGVDPARIGVYLGSGKDITLIDQITPALIASRAQDPHAFNVPEFLREAVATMAADRRFHEPYFQSGSHVARAVGAEGPNDVCITACAAGNHALGEARERLLRGDADVMLAGGTHSQVDIMSVQGYSTLGALSERNDEPERASRPFDRGRDGFVLGEGSGIVVLEELEHARKRGVPILAELVGYGNTADSYRVTDPQPDGLGAETAMRAAVRSAGLQPGDIDYISAHGTSTFENDKMETAAIRRIFGPKGEAPPVSSLKGMVGHLIAAAGAVEAIACIQSLRDGVITPTVNYEQPDPECDLDYVPNEAREAGLRHVLNASFGFGGQNIVTVWKRWEG